MENPHDKVVYFLTKAKILVEDVVKINGNDDDILPVGANTVLADVVEALEEEIDRAGDYSEYDPG